MQREKFVDGLCSGIKFTDAERNEIVKKAIEYRGIETTGIICMEEMADVYICLKYLEKVFEIHPDQILKAIDVKLLREKGRLDD